MRQPLVAAACLLAVTALFAQPKPPALPHTYPNLTTPANIGGQPGTAVDLTLTGTNLTNVTEVWTSFGGKVSIPEGQKDATKLAVKIEIPANTPVGLYSIRVGTNAGVSALRPFVVDDLPGVTEKDNNAISAPQPILSACVVTGTATAEASDYYKLPVNAGETLTFEVLARRIGSPCDPMIQLYDAAGKELFGLYADDNPGLQGDARLTHTFAAAGEVIVEVRDSTYRGGGDFAYRLRVGHFPGVTTAFPLAVERGKTADISFSGANFDGVKPVTVKGEGEVVNVVPRRDAGASGWPVPVMVHTQPESVEQEPNDAPEMANVMPVPGGVSARFLAKSDKDHFKFAGIKGKKVVIEVLTFEVNSPAEVYLRVLDVQGKELARSNPQQIGTRVEVTPPADGEYVIVCEHTNFLHGPDEVYHLSVKPVSPDFGISLAFDRADVPLGGVGVLPIVGFSKQNGFNGPVDVSFQSPSVSGQTTLLAGANPQPNAPAYLPLTVKEGTAPGVVVGVVTATAMIDGVQVTHTVNLLDQVKGGLANMPTPPAELTTQVAVAVVPAAPFTLQLQLDSTEVAKGGALKGKMTATRVDKFDAEITLSPLTLPPNVAPKLAPIKKGESEVGVEFGVPANVPPGGHTLVLRGAVKIDNKDVVVTAPPVTVTVTEPKK